jgi:hypothetical protein
MQDSGSIKLTGKPAIAVAVLAVLAFGFQLVASRKALDDEALAPIKLQLQGEYTSKLLPTIDPDDPDPDAVQKLLELDSIELGSVSVRGSGEDVVVRVEPRVRGALPPDGKGVRYFRMSYSSMTGWRVRTETTAFSYYTKLF